MYSEEARINFKPALWHNYYCVHSVGFNNIVQITFNLAMAAAEDEKKQNGGDEKVGGDISKLVPAVDFSKDPPDMSGAESVLDDCNWLVKDFLMIGKKPLASDEYFQTFLKDSTKGGCGIDTFLSILATGVTEYEPLINNLEKTDFNKPNLFALSVEAGKVPTEDALMEFCENIIKFIIKQNGKCVLYIHCNSGHNRGGTIAAVLIMSLYGINSNDATKWLNSCHEYRHGKNKCQYDGRLPVKDEQKKLIKDIEPKTKALFEKYSKKENNEKDNDNDKEKEKEKEKDKEPEKNSK